MRNSIDEQVRQLKEYIMKYFKESGKRHLLITGGRNSGKTTILKEILKDVDSYGGITTQVVRDGRFLPKVVMLKDINNPKEEWTIALRNQRGTELIPNINTFEKIGKEILNKYINSKVEFIVIDEIGFLESTAKDYQRTILNCMDNRETILVLRKDSTPFIKEIKDRQDVYLFDIDSYTKGKFKWTEKNIKWYLEAERDTLFYRKTIENISQYLRDVKTVLDIGCGIGGTSIELAKLDISVTAMDISFLAIETLRKRAEEFKFNNINLIEGDFEKTTIKEKYDMVIGSYVMGLINEENLDKFLNITNKYLVFLLPTENIKNDFSIQELFKRINRDLTHLKNRTHLDIIEILNKKGLKYDIKFFETEFNQPIKSIEEGVKFIKYYFDVKENLEEDVIEWLRDVVRVKDGKMYIPSLRKSSIIILKK